MQMRMRPSASGLSSKHTCSREMCRLRSCGCERRPTGTFSPTGSSRAPSESVSGSSRNLFVGGGKEEEEEEEEDEEDEDEEEEDEEEDAIEAGRSRGEREVARRTLFTMPRFFFFPVCRAKALWGSSCTKQCLPT